LSVVSGQAAVGLVLSEAADGIEASRLLSGDPYSPWSLGDSFRSCHPFKRSFDLKLRDTGELWPQNTSSLIAWQ
jgi:hypothetical protein